MSAEPRLVMTVPPPRGVPIGPVRVEVDSLYPNGNPGRMNIVCRECERLLFRVQEMSHVVRNVPWPEYEETYLVEKLCHNWRCKRLATVNVTRKPGHPLEHHAHDGAWHCSCGSYLGGIMGARGRVQVKCRPCRQNIRVTIADCMDVSILDAAVKMYRERHGLRDPDDDIYDLPF